VSRAAATEARAAATRTRTDIYLSRFAGFRREREAHEPDWLLALRDEGIGRFVEQGFPTAKNEEWKYTPLAALSATSFIPAECPAAFAAVAGRLEPHIFGSPDAIVAVFVNGRFEPRLSSLDRIPDGVTVGSLREALETRPELVEPVLARNGLPGGHVFEALNAAFVEDGVLVHIPPGRMVEPPIHLVYFTLADQTPAMTHPRTVIQAGEGSQSRLVESYVGEGAYFTNAVTDLVLDPAAIVSHVKVDEESPAATHVGQMRVRQERDSNFAATSISLGGALVRNDPTVLLNAEGAGCSLDGLYVGSGDRHVDNHTVVDHARPRTSSRQLYKGILDGRSRGVFFGRVLVRPDAQKIAAVQINNNLLLSRDALANSTPQLEIHADDVQCRHASTVGQLDEAMMFYLRSRGIGEEQARHVLTFAFANEILNRLRLPALRERLERTLFPEVVS
jgi:Fe-S cluster assembly protein SufD